MSPKDINNIGFLILLMEASKIEHYTAPPLKNENWERGWGRSSDLKKKVNG